MNVKELWNYIDATRALNRAQERLLEYEAIIYSPGGVRASGMPLDRSHDSPDRIASIADNHDKLIKERDSAQEKAAGALMMLYTFERELTEDESQVFFLRYVKGVNVREIEKALHKCERTVRYNLCQIKTKFKNFAPVCT